MRTAEEPPTNQQLKKIKRNPVKAGDVWNLYERRVFALLAGSNGTPMKASEIAAVLWPKKNKVKMERRVRNSLRKPVRQGFIEAKERGGYKVTKKARRALRK
jgi:predicted transcriptional regulator